MDPYGILFTIGILLVVVGFYFRTPIPVEPMKAIGGAAIAQTTLINPVMVLEAGIFTGIFWLLMGLTNAINFISRLTTKPLIRGIVLGLGLLFLKNGINMMRKDLVLAATCAGLGFLPTLVIPWLDRVASPLTGAAAAGKMVPPIFSHPQDYQELVLLGGGLFRDVLPAQGTIVVPADAGFSSISTTYLVIAIPLMLLLFLGIARLWGGKKRKMTVPVWDGGIPEYSADIQYTGTAYSNPVLVIFNSIYRPTVQTVNRFFASNRFRMTITCRRDVQLIIDKYCTGQF